MLGTRYEEHIYPDSRLPFHLTDGIVRTPYSCTHEANWHETLEVQRCTAGEGFVLLNGVRYSFRPGDVAVVNSDELHYTGAQESITYSCLLVDAQFCRQADLDPARLAFEAVFRDEGLFALLGELEALQADGEAPCRVARLRMTLLRVLIELRLRHGREKEESAPDSRSFAAVRETIRYIRANYSRRLTLDELARHIYGDKYRLAREFKQATGQTVVTYINRYRCQQAIEQIQEGRSVAEAAAGCGFHNMSFFARTCRACTGRLPSSFK